MPCGRFWVFWNRDSQLRSRLTSTIRSGPFRSFDLARHISLGVQNSLANLCRLITEPNWTRREALGGKHRGPRRVAGSLHSARMEIVDAIAQRDSAGAVPLVRDNRRKVIKGTESSPRAEELRETDRGFAKLLSAWLGANVAVGGGFDQKG